MFLPGQQQRTAEGNPQAGGLGQGESVNHRTSPPGEGAACWKGPQALPRCWFFFPLGRNLVAVSGEPFHGALVLLDTSGGRRKRQPPLLLAGIGCVAPALPIFPQRNRRSSPKPVQKSGSVPAPC